MLWNFCEDESHKQRKYILGKISKSTHKGSWKEITDKISDDIGITREDKVGKEHTNERKKNKVKSVKTFPGKTRGSWRQKIKSQILPRQQKKIGSRKNDRVHGPTKQNGSKYDLQSNVKTS